MGTQKSIEVRHPVTLSTPGRWENELTKSDKAQICAGDGHFDLIYYC